MTPKSKTTAFPYYWMCDACAKAAKYAEMLVPYVYVDANRNVVDCDCGKTLAAQLRELNKNGDTES